MTNIEAGTAIGTVSHFTEPQLAASPPSYPEWSAEIRKHYWHLRYARAFNSARVRREYRQIAKEKKRLHLAGVDAELVRLLCLHLVNPGNKRAERRWWDAFRQSEKLQWLVPLQLSLITETERVTKRNEIRESGSVVIPVLCLTGWTANTSQNLAEYRAVTGFAANSTPEKYCSGFVGRFGEYASYVIRVLFLPREIQNPPRNLSKTRAVTGFTSNLPLEKYCSGFEAGAAGGLLDARRGGLEVREVCHE